MQVLEKAKQTEFLGRDFLVWLWFKSEQRDGWFKLEDIGGVQLWVEGGITLKSESDEAVETVTCSGDNPRMREARFALAENKKISQVQIKLIIGDDEWSFTVDSTWMNFKALKTPRVTQDRNEDPEGIFYEKMHLIEQPVQVMESLFDSFIKLRISSEWEEEERPALIKWIKEGK